MNQKPVKRATEFGGTGRGTIPLSSAPRNFTSNDSSSPAINRWAISGRPLRGRNQRGLLVQTPSLALLEKHNVAERRPRPSHLLEPEIVKYMDELLEWRRGESRVALRELAGNAPCER